MLAKACHIGKIITPWLWLRGKKERKKKTLQIMTRTHACVRACALKRAHRWHGGEPYVPACWILIRTSKSLFGRLRSLAPSFTFLGKLAGRFSCRHIHGVRVKRRMRKDEREMDAQILFYVFFYYFFYVFNSLCCWWRISTKDEVEVGAVGQSRGGGTGKKYI